MRRSERSQTRLFRDTSLMVYITGAGACAPISAEILRLPVFEPVSFPCRRCFAGVHTSLARSSLIRSSADHNLGITATRSSVGLGWLAYTVMRSVTAHGFHCTRMEVSPREVRFQRFVPAGGPSLRMLVVPHLGIHMLFCRLLAQLYVSVGIRSLAIGLGSRSELAPRPLALKRPAIEHPTFQSLLPVPGWNVHTSCRLPQGDRRVDVFVVIRNLQHGLLVPSKLNFSVVPLHLVCSEDLGQSLRELHMDL